MKRMIVAVLVAVIVVAAAGVVLVAPGEISRHDATTSTAQQCVQKAFMNGELYCFDVERAITNASQAIIAGSQVMYVVTYPQLNSQCSANLSNCKQQTLPSGYSPHCNPCMQEAPAMYHDHVLAGLPASGSNGTFVVVVVAYAPAFSSQPSFSPVNSLAAVGHCESQGDFVRLNPTGANPYEMQTGTVLVLSVHPAT